MSEIAVPERPAWCLEEDNPGDERDNGIEEAAGRGHGKMRRKRGKEFQKEGSV